MTPLYLLLYRYIANMSNRFFTINFVTNGHVKISAMQMHYMHCICMGLKWRYYYSASIIPKQWDAKYTQHNAIHTQKLKETWIQCQNIIWIILSKRVEYPAIASTVSSEVSISFFDTTNDRKSIKRRHATVKSICDVNWHNSNVFYVIIHCYRCNFFASCKAELLRPNVIMYHVLGLF